MYSEEDEKRYQELLTQLHKAERQAQMWRNAIEAFRKFTPKRANAAQ